MDPSANSDSIWIVNALRNPNVYEGVTATDVEMSETHISWVFLVGDYVFKIKKPIQTSFLDYSTLERRKHFCEEECRLDQRYAPDLYLGVVAIYRCGDQIRVSASGAAAEGDVVEYAVKMRRFPDDALLSYRVASGLVTTGEVIELANCVARFHDSAACLRATREEQLALVRSVREDAEENLHELQASIVGEDATTLDRIRQWTDDYWKEHEDVFRRRVVQGYVRECHGDLHLANVIDWRGRLVPFDGIEFNDRFRWIDIISDAAFAAMDFAALGRRDLCRSFLNGYLEHTGDYDDLAVVRWYLVYRAMVRAKVAGMRSTQPGCEAEAARKAQEECQRHIALAYRFTLSSSPELWITHGVSGSGKTRVGESVVQHRGAIRLRSDLERKRLFGLRATDRPADSNIDCLYSRETTLKTYQTLMRQAERVIRAGFPVVVDATFLQMEDRQRFRRLADREGATFRILDCHAPETTLRQRLADRMAEGGDASDADLKVLDHQLETREPLTALEQNAVVDIPDVDTLIERL